jgi:hypothetical protein
MGVVDLDNECVKEVGTWGLEDEQPTEGVVFISYDEGSLQFSFNGQMLSVPAERISILLKYINEQSK